MSRTIDDRIVEMRFDNKQFEQNVQTSLSTLDKLKRSLNLDGAAKGLENVTSAAKNCNMSGLTSAVETVHAKFSAFEVMAVTALANITNSVINTGKQMLHSLTIEPITQGFEEYELKMGSIQTIMMSTGASLEDVNRYLNELNTYADRTIYSFADMTSNIGKFTNAGVKLEDAVMAIQGISNEAAVSGANANEASRAMYNFAQALSAGYVKLIDWKSIENANMATVEFKTQLLEAAVAAGTVEKTADGMYRVLTENNQGSTMDDAIDATKNFNDSLQYQWMTTEVLVNTLRDYADETTEIGKKAFAAAQEVKTFTQLMDTLKEAVGSGWAMTWEILFGNFEEAKGMWTDASNYFGGLIDSMSDARNSMLQGWKDLGGRTAVIEAVKNAFGGLVSVIKPIKEGFREIFPSMTAERFYSITNALKEFTSHLKLSDSVSANLKSTFKGVFALLDIGKQAFSALFNAILPLFGGFDSLGGGILNVTGNIGDFLVSVDEFIKKNDVFDKGIQGVISFVGKAADAVKDFAKEVKDKFNLPDLDEIKESLKKFLNTLKEKIKLPGLELIHSTLERIHERMSQVGEAAGNMRSGVIDAIGAMGAALANCKFLQLLQALWNGVKTIVGGIVKALGGLMDTIIEKMGNADFSGIIDVLNGLSIGGIALAISKFLNGFTKPLEGLDGILENVTGILDSVRGCFEAYQTQLKAGALLKIAGAIAILAASIIAISLIDSEKLSASLGAITIMFADLLASMAIFNKMGGATGKGTTKLIVFAGAVLILAGAVKKLSSLSWEELAVGLVGVGALLAEIDVFMRTAKFSKGAMTTATGMVILSAAIKMLAGVATDLAELSWEKLAKGLVGVGVLLAEVDVFLNTAKFSGKAMSTATGMVILAAAMKILASVCNDFGQMKWEEIGKGLAGIGALLLEVAAFTELTGNAKHVISSGLALIEIAAAMKIFASAMGDFAKFSWEQIAKGLVTMGGALAEIAITTKLMPKNMVGIGTGLVIVGAALEIVANALGKMGNFSWEQIAKGLVTMGVALAELAVGLNFMKGTLGGSAAMLVAATALAVLTPVLSVLGAMSWVSIAKGLVTIAGAFTVLGVAGAVLNPLVPAILGLSGAFALIGVGVLAIGAGLLAAGAGLSALAVGFTALAAAGAAGATAIVASLTVIITGVAGLIPAIIEKIGEGLIALCKVIAAGAPAIGEAVKVVVLTLVDVLVECVPAIADGALALIAGVLEAFVKYTPQIVDSIFVFLIEVLEGIAKHLPDLIKAAIDVLMSFFSGIVDALSGIDVDVLLKGIAGIGLLSAIMLALSAVASLVPGAMAGVLGIGVVIAELALVLAAIGALAQLPGLSWLIGEGGKLLEGIGTAIGQFIGGIVGGFMSGVSSQFPQIGADLSAFMTNVQPFIEGASRIDSSMMDGVKALGETILILTAADILQGLTSWITGGSSLSQFATELVPFGNAMKDFSVAIAGMDANIVANAATAGKTLAEMAATLPNSGGVVGFFAGENDMKAFGEQLVPFGEAMMDFSTAVKGLDADAIVNSATAGKALVELANTVPNSGGVVGFFAGENDMNLFGEQLVPFGEAMKAYSDAISGIDVEAITNSATAGKSLVELANTLPNTGGVVSWFTGDNDIGAFGQSLVLFGENFSQYSDYMKNVDAGIVTRTTNAASSIVELQKSLPKEGGWFSDDKSLADFGKDMSSFGSYFSSYYAYISGVDTGLLSSVITQTNRLVEMAKGMVGLDTKGMTSFSLSLTKLGETGITGFISAFDNAQSKVSTAASNMLTVFSNAANTKKTTLTKTFTVLIQAVLTVITGTQPQFYQAGMYLVDGFANGISKNTYKASAKSKEMAKAAADSARKELDEHSPSKVFHEIGDNAGEGFVEGMDDKISDAKQIGEALGDAAYSGIMDSVQEGGEQTQEIIEMLDEEILDDKREWYRKLIDTIEEGTKQEEYLGDEKVTNEKSVDERMKELKAAALSGEKDYWEGLLEIQKSGNNAQKYQSMSMVEFQKDILTQTTGILKTYTDELQSNTDALMRNSSLLKDITSSDDLTKNLQEQINQIEEYGNVMTSLNSRIADGGLKDAINQMGIDSLDELKIINGMTDEELSNYVGLYDQKYALCQQLAAQQLSGLQTETEAKLSALYGGAEVNLQQFSQSFDGTFESIRGYVGESINIGSQLASGVAEGIVAGTEESKQAAAQMITDTEEAAKQAADINSPSGLFRDQIGKFITAGVAEGMVAEEAKSQVKASTEEINNLALESFSETKDKFVQIGSDIVDSYREGISNSKANFANQCIDSMSNALSQMQAVIINSKGMFQSDASSIMTSFITGIKSQDTNARNIFTNIISGCLMVIKNKYAEIESVGQQCMIKLIAGVRSKEPELKNSFVIVLSACVTSIRDKYSDFYSAGNYLVEGFAKGIDENIYKAEAKSKAMAAAAAKAAKKELNEHSPSKVGYQIGDYFGVAFVNAIGDYEDKAYRTSADMANAAKNGLRNAISKVKDFITNGIDAQPTIRPVLDLSNVEAGTGRLNAMLSRTQALTISSHMNESRDINIQNGGDPAKSGSTFTFTQNNYSPKSLSRVEIYRQTNNQFSAFERMVKA